MKIIVDNDTRIVLMAGDNLTADEIAAQAADWCFDYQQGAFTVYDATLPPGYLSLHWTYSLAGVWAPLPASQVLIDSAIARSQTIATLLSGDVGVSAVLSEDTTVVAVDLTWDHVATATMYAVRYRIAGESSYITTTVLDSGQPTTSVRISGLKISTVYLFSIRAQTQWGMSAWSDEVQKTTPDSLTTITDALTRINPDITQDKLAKYLLKEISFTDLIETVNAALFPGAVEDGSIALLPEVVYSFSRDAVQFIASSGQQAAQLEILADRVSLKLNSHGHIAGMAMGWDDSGDVSETVFLTDVFKIALPDGTGIKEAFTLGLINGAVAAGLHGDLIIDGSLKARHIAANELYIGMINGVPGKIIMGEGAFIQWSNLSDETKANLKGADGTDGTNGANGVNGLDGVSITWQGSLANVPASPQNGWAYYNTTSKKSYVYQSGTWYQMTVDGVDGANGANGADGLSIVWKGDSANPPANPVKNWVYRDTDNSQVYIYDGSAWVLMVADGNDGTPGTDGSNGLSVYITYNDNALTSTPSAPTGDGTIGGWHTNPTAAVVWMSQKVSAGAIFGAWGAPIPIKGTKGDTGTPGADGTSVPFFQAPSGNGFYVDGTHLGYYQSGAWKAYMDINGFLSGCTVNATSINAGTFGAGVIYAGAITASQVNASGFTAQTANIADAAIASVKIANGAITNVTIGTAAITTLKIGSNQVTIPVYSTNTTAQDMSGNAVRTLTSFSIDHSAGSFPVVISVTCILALPSNNPAAGILASVWIERPGATLGFTEGQAGFDCLPNMAGYKTITFQVVDQNPYAQVNTYTIKGQAFVSYGSVPLSSASFFATTVSALGAKR